MFENITNEGEGRFIMWAVKGSEATVAYGIDWARGESTFMVIALNDVFLQRAASY